MAERTVGIGLATFRRADVPEDAAVWAFGLLGEVVDVHADDLERFDRLNAAGPSSPEPLSEVAKAAESSPTEPPRSGRGSGVDAWVEYAESLDLLVPEDATRDEVIALVDESK